MLVTSVGCDMGIEIGQCVFRIFCLARLSDWSSFGVDWIVFTCAELDARLHNGGLLLSHSRYESQEATKMDEPVEVL